CCARSAAALCGTISRIRRSTSPSAGASLRHNSTRSKPSSAPHPMKRNRQYPSNLRSQPDWQLARLRRYLRETGLPFSSRYGAIFRREGIDPAQLRTLDDLRRIPFTTKRDFFAGADGADPVRDFVLKPDRAVLARRPSTIARALLRGRAAVAEGFER